MKFKLKYLGRLGWKKDDSEGVIFFCRSALLSLFDLPDPEADIEIVLLGKPTEKTHEVVLNPGGVLHFPEAEEGNTYRCVGPMTRDALKELMKFRRTYYVEIHQ